ncbi:MAG: LysE family translocator [Alphaproteobacteria bacterium]|nr:LysE family translocator [Alphaproteobacteria bacterium]
MDVVLFLKAALIGLSIAAPVGPIGLLCIERGLTRGPVAAFMAGLGAAAADAVYGALAGFGVTFVTSRLVEWQAPIRTAGGILLAMIAWRTLRAGAATSAATLDSRSGLAASFIAVFALTLANPATILSFVAIFSSFGDEIATQANPLVVVIGVFIGSAAWWLTLAGLVAILRDRLPPQALRWIRVGSAAMLGGFAIWSIAGAAW